ncbi:MAG: hypothetical protein Q7R41_05090 [Phycisphaerales bacterium]|nr:hypothetical protein [Phycisphaerales bacterium]
MQPTIHEESRPIDQDLGRLKADLGTLRQAAGLEPPWGREDIRAHLAVAAGGAVALVWALLPTGLPAHWGTVPLILICIGYVTWMRTKYRRGSGRSPMRRREYTSEIVGMFVVGALAFVYRLWAAKLGISTTIAGSAAFFVLGLALLIPVLRDRNRLPDLGVAVPLMVCGLVIPFCPVSLWVVLGATFMIGGLATAAITAQILRGAAANHVAD